MAILVPDDKLDCFILIGIFFVWTKMVQLFSGTSTAIYADGSPLESCETKKMKLFRSEAAFFARNKNVLLGCSFVAKLTNCFKLVPRSFERKNRRKTELLKNKIMKLKKLLEARNVIERTTPFSKFCKNWGLLFFQTEFDFWFQVSRSNFCFSATFFCSSAVDEGHRISARASRHLI